MKLSPLGVGFTLWGVGAPLKRVEGLLWVALAALWGMGIPLRKMGFALWGMGGPLCGLGVALWGVGGLLGVAADPGVTRGPQPLPERETSAGRVRGYLHHVTQLNATIERYLAIPYAAPPVGSLRFEPPQPPTPWSGVRNATELSPACYAVTGQNYIRQHLEGFSLMSEDCLYLNVYLPVLAHAQYPLPVLVYVHGGGNLEGMGAMLHPDVFAVLAQVVVVNFNYRLGALGFYGLGEEGFRGNFGLLDQTFAFRWVKDNIHHFGGDPAKVTIQGHSSGGADVGCHVVSHLSQGLFRYAIMSSGFPLAYFGVEEPPMSVRQTTLEMASKLGCNASLPASDVKDCLKQCSLDRMEMTVNKAYIAVYSFVPLAIDGHFLRQHPTRLMDCDRINGQAFMLGVTANDGGLNELFSEPSFVLAEGEVLGALPPTDAVHKVPHVADLVLSRYSPVPPSRSGPAHALAVGDIVGDSTFRAPAVHTADLLSVHRSSIFLYSFDFDSELSEDVGVYHGDDLFYLWGYPFIGHFRFRFNEADRDVSREMAALWGSFIRTGNPRPRQGKSLLPYSPAKKFYFRVAAGQNGSVVVDQGEGLRSAFMAFWNSELPRLAACRDSGAGGARDLADVTVTRYSPFTIVFICLSAALSVALVAVSVSFYFYCKFKRPYSEAASQ